jgi:protein phosphatase
MRWEQQIQFASISDVGFRRRNNEDAATIRICPDRETWEQHGHLFLVADGMGGHAVGELASKVAIDTVPHSFFKASDPDVARALKAAIEDANAAIYERSTHNTDFHRMGTTCVALALAPVGAVIGHVGDSRVYRIRGDVIEQLTYDHSLQWELARRPNANLSEIAGREPRHVITRSLGPEPSVQVDIEGPHETEPRDTYLICSDGLSGHLTDAEIGMIASTLLPSDACQLLVNLSNLRGGNDNITVVIARLGDIPGAVSSAVVSDDGEQETRPKWWWWLGMWSIAIIFVIGVYLALFSRYLAGVAFAALAAFAAVGMFALWLELRSKEREPSPEEAVPGASGNTAYGRASSRFLPESTRELSYLVRDLEQTARQEGWKIDWARYETARSEATSLMEAGQHRQAFAQFATTFEVLMSGLRLYRKQLNHERKWGKDNPLPSNRLKN